jgi:hypothetical protein
MTQEQRDKFNHTKHLRSLKPYHPELSMAYSPWCWLKGLRTLPDKRAAGSARFVFELGN